MQENQRNDGMVCAIHSSNGITDQHLCALAEVPIKRLYLNCINLTDAWIDAFRSWKQLVWMDIVNCSGMHNDFVRTLTDTSPTLNYLYIDDPTTNISPGTRSYIQALLSSREGCLVFSQR